jgi:uncharacterized Ntn-hydrolase superfamily protein
MTPADIAAHNRTAPRGGQIHRCRHCGRHFTGPGCAGWRIDAAGQAYARTGMCSSRCVDADMNHPHPRSYHHARHPL